jgi:HD superfamily phosphohydrolase YqeK
MECAPMKPHEIFTDELESISDPKARELVRDVLVNLETANLYFYKAPASRSRSFHPPCCNVQSGLLRHVKRAVSIGHHLCTAYGMSQRERDIVTAALILHDIWKNDFQRHASRAGDYVFEIIINNTDKYASIGAEFMAEIIRAIRLHMGRWAEPELRKPIPDYSLVELVVYTADYISSRNDIGMPQQDTCDLPIEIECDLVK